MRMSFAPPAQSPPRRIATWQIFCVGGLLAVIGLLVSSPSRADDPRTYSPLTPSRENYEYLGRHWAGCGNVSVHLQHLGSDDAIWKDLPRAERFTALKKATLDLSNSTNRPLDVSFAITRLNEENAGGDELLKGRLDLSRVGVSGHSFGGYTTLAVAGLNFGPLGDRFKDPRIKAAIQMSAPVVRKPQQPTAYERITIPLMHMTGTRDDSPIGDTKPDERRIPFDRMSHAETCLVIFEDGDHMIFSGRERLAASTVKEQDEHFARLICAGTTAFWDAYLNDNAAANNWLLNGGYEKLLAKNATFEKKSATAKK